MKSLAAILLSFFLVASQALQEAHWLGSREKTSERRAGYYRILLASTSRTNFRELTARMAVSVRAKTGQPTVGIVYLHARTDANLDTRNVVLSQLEITSTKFPIAGQTPVPPRWISWSGPSCRPQTR